MILLVRLYRLLLSLCYMCWLFLLWGFLRWLLGGCGRYYYMLIQMNNVFLKDICWSWCWGQVGLSRDPSSCSALGPQSKLPLDGVRGHIIVCPHSQQFLGSVLELEIDSKQIAEKDEQEKQVSKWMSPSMNQMISLHSYIHTRVPIGSPLCCKVRSQNFREDRKKKIHKKKKKSVSLTRLRALALVSLRILTQITIRMGMTKQAP